MAKRTVEELQAYRDEFDALRMSSFALPEDWEVDLFSEDDRKENRKNELKRLAGLLGGENGREAVGGTHSSPEKSPSPLVSSPQSFFSPADSMGSTISKSRQYRRNFGGFDGGVEIGFSGKWSRPRFVHLCDRLSEAKAEADNEQTGFKIIELGGCPVAVSATGAGGKIKYKFILQCGGIKIYVHSNPKSTVQPFRVRFGFEALCKESLFTIYDRLVDWLEEIGFTVTDEKLSRVDKQVMTERPVSDYVGPVSDGRAVSLARGKSCVYFDESKGTVNSYTRGKSIQICIYDKRDEILSAHTDDVKYELFRREILDDGPLPEHLTRIEFRLDRKALKRYGINTMQDLKESAHSMAWILTHEWFRILDGPRKKNNESRQEVAECWKEVQDLFDYYFDFSDEKDFDYHERSVQELKDYEPEKTGKNADNLVRQACGCLSSVAALVLNKVNDTQDMLDFAFGNIEKYIVQMIDKFTIKRKHNEVIRGYTPLVLEADFSEGETPWDCLDDSVMERVRKEYFKRLEENSTPF